MMKRVRILLSILVMLGSFLLPVNVAMAADRDMVLEGINNARKENGLKPYTLDEDFCKLAEIRACEQAVLYSHQRPDGRMWYSIDKRVNRENIAHLLRPEHESLLMQAWMDCGIHRANILSDDSTKIGIGICKTKEGDEYIVTLTD